MSEEERLVVEHHDPEQEKYQREKRPDMYQETGNVVPESLVEEATRAIANLCTHDDPISVGCDCPDQGLAATLAILRELEKKATTELKDARAHGEPWYGHRGVNYHYWIARLEGKTD